MESSIHSSLLQILSRWTVGKSWQLTTCLKLSCSSWKEETSKRHFSQSYPNGKAVHTQPVKTLLRTSSPGQKGGTAPARESTAGMTPTHHRKKSRTSRAARCPEWVLSHSEQLSLAVLPLKESLERVALQNTQTTRKLMFLSSLLWNFKSCQKLNDNEKPFKHQKRIVWFCVRRLKGMISKLL